MYRCHTKYHRSVEHDQNGNEAFQERKERVTATVCQFKVPITTSPNMHSYHNFRIGKQHHLESEGSGPGFNTAMLVQPDEDSEIFF